MRHVSTGCLTLAPHGAHRAPVAGQAAFKKAWTRVQTVTAAASESMQDQAGQLEQLVNIFKLEGTGPQRSVSAPQPRRLALAACPCLDPGHRRIRRRGWNHLDLTVSTGAIASPTRLHELPHGVQLVQPRYGQRPSRPQSQHRH